MAPELPDPLTLITWGSWLEINPETATRLGIARGDLLQVQSPFGSLEVPAYPYHGVHPDTVAMPMGQGHTVYGQFADSQPNNPLMSPEPDPSCSYALVSFRCCGSGDTAREYSPCRY